MFYAVSTLFVVCFVAASTSQTTGASGGRCNPPTQTAPSYFTASPNCALGTNLNAVKNGQRFRCHCWGHCGYVCNPNISNGNGNGNGNGGGGGGGNIRTTTRRTSPCAFGGVWFPPNKNLKCICQSLFHIPYYSCQPIGSSTNGTTAGTTAASGATGSTTAASATTGGSATGGSSAASGATGASDSTTGGTGATSDATTGASGGSSEATTGGSAATSEATSGGSEASSGGSEATSEASSGGSEATSEASSSSAAA